MVCSSSLDLGQKPKVVNPPNNLGRKKRNYKEQRQTECSELKVISHFSQPSRETWKEASRSPSDGFGDFCMMVQSEDHVAASTVVVIQNPRISRATPRRQGPRCAATWSRTGSEASQRVSRLQHSRPGIIVYMQKVKF